MNIKLTTTPRTLFFLLLIAALFAVACDAVDEGALETPDVEESGSTVAYPGFAESDSGSESAYPAGSSILDDALNAPLPPEELPTFPGQIAFQTERYLSVQVALLDGETGATTRLTQIVAQSFEPSWSPDCSTLVFSIGEGNNGDFALYTQDFADRGQEAHELLFNRPDSYDWSPAWSPAGGVIAYQNNRENLINICFVDEQGNDLGCMERGNYSNAMPAWSPDGTRLAFGSNRAGNWELYVTDYPELSSITRLTENSDIDFHPEFSPDGFTIVFTSQRGADYNLYTIQPNGENEQQITSDGADERDPTWVGNDQIAFAGGFEEEMELYLINADGSDRRRLTYSPGLDQWPVWCPGP